MRFPPMFACLVLVLLPQSASPTAANRTTPKLPRKKSVVSLLLTTNASAFSSNSQNSRRFCRLFRGLKHQSKLCQRRNGLPELLNQTRTLTLQSCRSQFEYEQWNCSTPMKKFFKKVYRETAFMYSLTTSAFMYLVAKACAQGKLTNCKCASHGKSSNSSEWQWGGDRSQTIVSWVSVREVLGCGDNAKYAKVFTRKFFQLRKSGDYPSNILKHNSEIGIDVVLKYEERPCKCHGLSGSCSIKICFKRLRPFEDVARELRARYHAAIQAEPPNAAARTGAPAVAHARHTLLYLDRSPSFCARTSGRRCASAANCATLCCGGGWTESTRYANRTCDCAWRPGELQLDCHVCRVPEQVLTCD